MKNIRFFLSESFHFFGGKIFSIFEQACFRNVYTVKFQLMTRTPMVRLPWLFQTQF